MFPIKQNVSVQDLIDLDAMLSKQLAVVESEGEIITLNRGRENEQEIDERVLNVSHAEFCQRTGDRKPDCQYSLPMSFLLEIGEKCARSVVEIENQKKLLIAAQDIIGKLTSQKQDSEKKSVKKGKAA